MSKNQMNISGSNIAGQCNYKCNYSYNYPVNNCVLNNMGSMIKIDYPATNVPPVTFNNNTYNVSNIMIYMPSQHLFNNTLAQGEIIIMHQSLNTKNPLLVCIPISINGNSGKGSNLLGSIIIQTSKLAPGNKDTSHTQDFTINDMISTSNYYYHTVSVGNDTADIVVFGIENGLFINNENLKVLQQLLPTKSIQILFPINACSSLFINDSGVARVSSTGESEIYIDCQPTDISKESEEVVIKKPNISFDINTDWANNEYVFLILIIIGFGLFIYVMYKLLHYFTENADKGLEYLQGAM
jgi:carbonic anhydrase